MTETINAFTPERLAKILSQAFRRQITTEQVEAIIDAGNLRAADGTVNLLRYTAWLAQNRNNKEGANV